MPLKPLPLKARPRPKPLRLPRGKAVTIAAGFRFNDGVVLCADTQETVLHAKSAVPKLRIEPFNKLKKDSPQELVVAMAGSGDGPWIDHLTEISWRNACDAVSFDDACARIERTLKDAHREYAELFQVGYMPQADLVYGVKMQGRSSLFKASGPIVNRCPDYSSIGAGYYMADFLASRMHHSDLTASECSILAAYVLFQCKEYVEGCGGDSHIAVLKNSGKSFVLGNRFADRVSLQLQVTDGVIAGITLNAANKDISTRKFKALMRQAMEWIDVFRKESRKEIPDYEQALARLKEEHEHSMLLKSIRMSFRAQNRKPK